tara:strand:- start:688 stop:1317 length:630 start_codon:yes stop_codon:yes gene_type:complete
MAIVQNTLIGRANGRVGNAVFTTWKGRNILKQKPEIVANPRTSGQVAQRGKFIMALAFGKLLRPILQMGFREYAGTVSWLNRFMSVNLNNEFLTFATDKWEPDFTQIVISEGSLYPTVITLDSQDDTGVVIEWPTSPINNQTAEDAFFAVAIGATAQTFDLGTVTRSAGTQSIGIASTVGDTVYVACFFMNTDTLKVSNSMVLSVEITA